MFTHFFRWDTVTVAAGANDTFYALGSSTIRNTLMRVSVVIFLILSDLTNYYASRHVGHLTIVQLPWFRLGTRVFVVGLNVASFFHFFEWQTNNQFKASSFIHFSP